MMISKYTINIIEDAIKELNTLKIEMEKKLGLAYRRTNIVVSKYNEAVEMMINLIDNNLQRTISMKPLSKNLLLKELINEGNLIE